MTEQGWEDELAAVWERLGRTDDETFRAEIEAVAGRAPAGSAGAADFERAASLDSTSASDLAVPLYRAALREGLVGERRRRAVIQLASSLRNVGEVDEAVALLRAELERPPDGLDDAVRGFLALALADAGQPREGLRYALEALAPHLPRYQRSLGNYARLLVDPARP